MPLDSVSIERPEPTIEEANAYFAALEADAQDYRIRKKLRWLGFDVPLPVDEDE